MDQKEDDKKTNQEVEKMKTYLILAAIMMITMSGCDQQPERQTVTPPAAIGETDLTISQGTQGHVGRLFIGVINTHKDSAALGLHTEEPNEEKRAVLKIGESDTIGNYKVTLLESEEYPISGFMPGQASGKIKVRVTEKTQEQAASDSMTYEGGIPCADCPGINETLTLRPDGTYTESMVYLERNEGKAYLTEGTWNKEKKNDSEIFVLNPAGKDSRQSQLLITSKNRIEMLDGEGNRIPSQLNYALNRKQ